MSDQMNFFHIPNDKEKNLPKSNQGIPKLKYAIRNQIEVKTGSIDDLLPKNHLARNVWRYVEKLNLNIALQQIQSMKDDVGRSATDPKILLSLWMYATLEGIGSARLLAEYCTMHDAFKWICGGVSINYHTLSDFRSLNGELFDDLLKKA